MSLIAPNKEVGSDAVKPDPRGRVPYGQIGQLLAQGEAEFY